MQFSVVITTFNRASALPRAIESVLSQPDVGFELIVVNDGSTDQTASLLVEQTDPRVTVVHRDNGGLSAARNSGIKQASGEWIIFLDDDDMALPGWLATLWELTDQHTGVVCCAAEYCTPEGRVLAPSFPKSMGPLFNNQIGLFLAGTFAVRTDLLRAIDGYDERLTCSHQTELAMRLIPAMADRRLRIRNTNSILLRIERRDARDRPMSNPAALYQGTRILLDKHHDTFAKYPIARARSNGILGVSAARLGNWPAARSALLASARAEPRSVRRWVRLAAACYPPVARRVWRVAEYDSQVLT